MTKLIELSPEAKETLREFPATEDAYELALQASKQSDRSWEKADDSFFRLIALSTPLTLPIPILSRVLNIEMNLLAWMCLACLILIMALAFYGRCRLNKKTVIDPMAIWSGHLSSNTARFKMDMIHEIGSCFASNEMTIKRKWQYIYGCVVLLGVQGVLLSIWLILAPSAEEPSSPSSITPSEEVSVLSKTDRTNKGTVKSSDPQPSPATGPIRERRAFGGGDPEEKPQEGEAKPPPQKPEKSATTEVHEKQK